MKQRKDDQEDRFERRERRRAIDMKSAEATRPNVAGTLDSEATAQLAEACPTLPSPLPKLLSQGFVSTGGMPPFVPELCVHQSGGGGHAGSFPMAVVTWSQRLMVL
jgi:hypothetical protein